MQVLQALAHVVSYASGSNNWRAHLDANHAVHHRARARLLIHAGGSLAVFVDPKHAGGVRVVVHEYFDCRARHSHACVSDKNGHGRRRAFRAGVVERGARDRRAR